MAGHLRPEEGQPLFQVLPDAEALARRAAELFVMAASSSISVRGFFSVAFSGGTTPGRLFELLALDEYSAGVQWGKVHVFFVDERCVPPGHELSNYRLASDALLSKVKAIVHRIHGELGPEEAAGKYAGELEGALGNSPVLDMVFLGMGQDGHTASLFTGSEALSEKVKLAVPVIDREPPRVSLSLPVINAARTIVFHVTGENKAAAVRQALGAQQFKGGPAPPAALVTRRALWLLDEAAAEGLPKQ